MKEEVVLESYLVGTLLCCNELKLPLSPPAENNLHK